MNFVAAGTSSQDRPAIWATEMTCVEDSKRRLIWHGMFLFLLGLLTGFVEQQFNNPRMGLAAHLEGVMNGTFLTALGAVWTEVRLTSRLKAGAYWSALYGAYGNWTAPTLAAIFGAASLSPIIRAGHGALPWQEPVVTIGFSTVGIVIIVSSVLVLWGLRAPQCHDRCDVLRAPLDSRLVARIRCGGANRIVENMLAAIV